MIFLSLFECLVLTLLASGESMGELCCVPSTHIQRNVQYNLNVKDVLTSSSNFHRSLWPQPNKIILHNTNHSTINVLYLSPHLCLEIYVGDQLKTQQNAILRSAFITKICPNIPTTSPPTSQLSLPDNVHINSVRKLVVRLKLEGEPITPTANSIESYELDIRAPVATIQATEVWGARHAFETFFQLVGRDNHGFSFPWFRPVKIIDEPKYSWRGLMLDTSRHYFSITSIQRTLQAMSMNKLNVFHWHISDAPSYPLILNNTPELGLLGSHRSDMVYTENDIRSIVSFSHIHGIRVVPEIDIPSHVASWGKSYPNVVIDCSSYASIDSDEYKRKDKDVLDPTNEKTYQLIGWVLDDLVNNFPDDYIHLGGDEVDLRCFNNEVMSRARVMFGDVNRLQLLQTFWNRVIKMVLDRKKIPIVWQGTYDSRIVLHKSVAVQSWKCWGRPLLGVQSFLNSRMDGHDVIQSSCYYLDWDSKFIDYYQQNRFHDHHRSGSSSSSSSNGQIFGGEICAWSETMDEFNLECRLWPRSLSVAERFWSRKEDQNITNLFVRRDAQYIRMLQIGINDGGSFDKRKEYCSHVAQHIQRLKYNNMHVVESRKNNVVFFHISNNINNQMLKWVTNRYGVHDYDKDYTVGYIFSIQKGGEGELGNILKHLGTPYHIKCQHIHLFGHCGYPVIENGCGISLSSSLHIQFQLCQPSLLFSKMFKKKFMTIYHNVNNRIPSGYVYSDDR